MSHRELLIERVRKGYRSAYGEDPQAIFAAPGRVNLIGEHTDYNDGLVLPCAIDREAMIAIGPGPNNAIEAIALDMKGERDRFDLGEAIAPSKVEWTNHIRGVAHFLQHSGVQLAPARLVVAGSVPLGAGLSSSAALGVVSALSLSRHSGAMKEPSELAQIAQQAENVFVGTQCGIMDQMASAAAREGHALLLDCRSLETRHIAMPDALALIIIDSGVRHSLGDSPYNERRAQCEEAARHYGAVSLRDVSEAKLDIERGELGEVEYARARHVVTEIARVSRFAKAMKTFDVQAISQLMTESFHSYRDDFEASVPQVDRLFNIARDVIGDAGGVRLTGGGFGGSLIALAPSEVTPDLAQAIDARHNQTAETPARLEVFKPAQGADQVA